MGTKSVIELSNESYHLIMQANNEGIWDWNLVDNSVYYSDRFYEQLGYDPGELPYHLDTFIFLVHPDDKDRTFDAVRRHCEERAPYNLEFRLRHKQGHSLDIITRGQAVWNDCGQAIRMIGTHLDISDKKRLVETLSAKEQHLRDCFQMANIGTWEYFLNESGPRWSDEVCKIHEVPIGHCPSLSEAVSYFPEEARQALVSAMERAQMEHGTWDLELPFNTAKEKKLWVRALGRAILSNGKTVGFRGVFQDITQRKIFENELLQAKQQAEEANITKSQFLATMSHELRTPMNAILGMTKLALQTDINEDQRDLLSTVESSAESLLSLLNSILDFARIEVNKLELEELPFDLSEIATRVIKLLSVKGDEKCITINCEIDVLLPKILVGDGFRFSQVMMNLISNAIKFTEPHGVVAIRVSQLEATNDEITISLQVADSGIGISPEAQQRIFEEFRQAEQSTARRYGGSGLGLTIAKKLSEMMGGTLTLTSCENHGTIFTASMNFRKGNEPTKPVTDKPKALPTEAPESILRILIAEDNLVNFHLARRILEKRGHTVIRAANGREATQLLAREPESFSLVLMDCQMPVVDGFEATQLIRNSVSPYATIPIIALTANAYPSDRDKCLKFGMNAYISKPFDTSELISIVEQYGMQQIG